MENQEVSYSIGALLGANLTGQINVEDMDFAQMAKGIEDMLNNNVEGDINETMRKAQMYLQKIAAEAAMGAIENELKFMEENAKKEGVIALPSGLQYEILTEGHGRKPRRSDKVTVHYEGKLLSGKVFDSSIKRGQPAKFPVGGLIQGWQEALQIMPEGSKWRLYIPSKLAYGQRGAGNDIPANATLIFEMELLGVGR
ncbi:MAG: FKBP-type peptidyl-prolyl cis-trans isomerase [Aureispira sp.]|nr:FKBP-type peptidyl-prolyl cis-trans isomerase [Aureispira sp.]